MPPKLASQLAGKPSFPILYETVMRDHRKQVVNILDQISTSRSPAAQEAVENPNKLIKWELIFERGEDPALPADYDQIVNHLSVTSKAYLKANAGSATGSGGRIIKIEPLDVIPERIMALIEQRARLLADQHEERPGEIVQGQIVATNGVSLVAQLDSWYEKHPNANRRLYYVARDVLKNLMESEGDVRR